MSNVKERVIQIIKKLPGKTTIDDILAELYFRIEVDKGLQELDAGQGIPHREVEKRMKKWLRI